MMKEMKAAVFKGVENMQVETRPIPECPKDGLLIKVHYCGICGGDVRNFHNGLKGGVTDQIMGHEISGEVVEAAENLRFKVGDRVALAPDVSCGSCWYCKRGLVNLCENHRMLGTHFPGGFAQYIAIPGEVLQRGFVERIPDGMSYEHAAFAEPCAGVVACQSNFNITMGETVAIIGDGPIGCLHLEVARARGAKVIMMALDKIKLAETFAPDHLIYNGDPDAATQEVLRLTDGRGVDVVILAVPSVAVQAQALQIVRKRGRVIVYGGVPKSAELAALNSNRIHYNEITVAGSFSYPATGLANALAALQSGAIHADKYLSEVVSLEHVTDGMAMMRAGKALKVLINPWL